MPPTKSPTIAQALTTAIQHHQRGELGAAEAIYRQILARDAHHSDALHLLGVIEFQTGHPAQAEQLIRRALVAAGAPVAMYYNSLGLAQQDQAHMSDALQSFRTAHRLEPSLAEITINLANALRLAGQPDEAENLCRQGLALHPALPEMHYTLGMALRQQGRSDDARNSLQQALILSPDAAEVHNGLGLLYQELGQHTQALKYLQRAAALQPGKAETFNNLGNSLSQLGRLTEAVRCFQQALTIQPDLAETHANLGNTYQEMGRPEDASAAYLQAYRLGGHVGARIRSITTLPVIPESADEIREYRRRMEQGIDALLTDGVALTDPLKEIGRANFFLAYHGQNNRTLHSKLARLYHHACPSLSWAAPHCVEYRRHAGPLRVGFISQFMYHHSIGKTTRGLIAELSREHFEIHALFVPPFVTDDVSSFIRDRADQTVDLLPTLEGARRQIAALELDVLFYQDIGMEPFTYFLAFSRLAPVQCLSFGHPDTTGIPNMDYWVSSDLFEPPDAQEHYSEQLALLHNLGTLAYYHRPTPPDPLKPRAAFGLPADANVYLCPQTLFKFHPDFDQLLGNILRADPRGLVVLVESKNPQWVELLHARFARHVQDVASRIVFVPPQSGPDFANMIAVSDVMLDTIHFNGMNTSLEAFAVGTPVVTLPKDFQRGRHTLGMYTRMGIRDCVAGSEDEYVRIATRLATEPDFNRRIRHAILANSHVLYEDPNVVREFERFFIEAVTLASRA
jgi:predicted O-linked N-acetylglucosamine transferase (SPINDLY family)